MTKFTQKTGLSNIHIGTYLTIIGMLGSIAIGLIKYASADSAWKAKTDEKISAILYESKQNIADHNVLMNKIDTIDKKVDIQNNQIKMLKATKQNKKVITPADLNIISFGEAKQIKFNN